MKKNSSQVAKKSIILDIGRGCHKNAGRTELLRHIVDAKSEAEEANRSRDLFLSTLSHELRTPMTSLILQSQLILGGKLNKAQTRNANESIEKSAKIQVQIIEDLLDISKIATGTIAMHRQTVDLSTVVLRAAYKVRAYAESRSIVIEEEIDNIASKVWGDPTRLKQIFWNLLVNAIKFSPKNAHVRITLKTIGHNALIQVADSGIGIDADFLPEIFSRFCQADASTTRNYSGLGLGLAIVRHLVEMHGGKVIVESLGKGQGATFSVTLPLIVDA